MSHSNKLILDIFVYMFAALCDSFGIALMIQTNFGATPFGILTSNAAMVFPITVGACSFVYEMCCIFLAGRISKGRIKWELFIYSIIFALLIDLHLSLLPNMGQLPIWMKIVITLAAIVLIDLAKSFFHITVFPKLSTVELIYQVSERYDLKLGVVSKLLNGFNVLVGLAFSFLARHPFHNLGIGTVLSLVLFGYVLQYTSPLVENGYRRIVKNDKSKLNEAE